MLFLCLVVKCLSLRLVFELYYDFVFVCVCVLVGSWLCMVYTMLKMIGFELWVFDILKNVIFKVCVGDC